MSSKAKPFLALYTPEVNNFTISDLISHLQWTFISDDFALVTDILSARDDKAKQDYDLLEDKHSALLLTILQTEDELNACKKENEELKELMLRSKDGCVIQQLRGKITSVERDERKAKALVEFYKSRFEKLVMRVARLEEDAKVLLMADQLRADEEARERNGESQGQLTEEIACASKETKKAERSNSHIAGGEIKVPEDSNVNLKTLCCSQCATAPTTTPSNNIETSGTSTQPNYRVLIPCEEKISSEQTSEHLRSQIRKYACEDSSSDDTEDDGGDWKNEEDMIMAIEKDPELCIRAICALYREKSFTDLELHNTENEEMLMAFRKDPELCMKAICALRGTALAEFLIWDPQAKLKKDEKSLLDCKRIAKVYSRKLFEIYKKDKDQLLSPLKNYKTPTLAAECIERSSRCMDCLFASNAEEKELELLFLQWSEHQKKPCSFWKKTKAKPPIYYVFNKPLEEDAFSVKQRKEQFFHEWMASRPEELSKCQKHIGEQNLANLEYELERWRNARTARSGNNNMMNLQITMDQEVETRTLEHGPII